jgi:hypothetical protein
LVVYATQRAETVLSRVVVNATPRVVLVLLWVVVKVT